MVQLTDFAANEAAKRHAVGTADYVEAGKRSFFEHLTHLQEQAQASMAVSDSRPSVENNEQHAEPVMTEPTQPFFKPSAAKPPTRSIVSAPISRTVPTSGPRPDWQTGRTTLSVAEKEAAAIAGVDLETYAKNKLRMLAMKEKGEIQGCKTGRNGCRRPSGRSAIPRAQMRRSPTQPQSASKPFCFRRLIRPSAAMDIPGGDGLAGATFQWSVRGSDVQRALIAPLDCAGARPGGALNTEEISNA